MTEPIRKTITVPLPAEEAFELFTAAIDTWWPKQTHSVSSETGDGRNASVRIEPYEGGNIIETQDDGTEAAWATVTIWKPGNRLSLEWYPGRNEDESTHVDVTFEQTEAGTRVDLIHDGFDRFGATAETMCANYDAGWDHVLGGCYRGHCTAYAA